MLISTRFSRRNFGLAVAAPALLVLAGCNDSSTSKAPTTPPAPAKATASTEATVNVAELNKPGDLPDVALGKADAPVTIVEYASMTCGHCATFHTEGMPHLKTKYIDTGKVRYILREFPLDPVAYAAALLARCAGEERFHAVVDLLFKQQRTWAFSDKPETTLFETVKQAGFTQEAFNACLQDQGAYAKLQKERQRASQQFGVDSTPTFFINGRIQRGAMTPEQIDKVLEPYLAAKQ